VDEYGTTGDITGSNGELLGQILRAAPHLRGVLLERPDALEAGRSTLAQAGCADRCCTTGTMTSVGHPETVRRGEARARKLLIVERLLPVDDSPSPPVSWNIHIMCNVGGRERTAVDGTTAGCCLTRDSSSPPSTSRPWTLYCYAPADRRQSVITSREIAMSNTASAGSYLSRTGECARDQRYLTTRITTDGRDGFPVQPGRYRLVVSRACPWANRAIIVRRLLGLEDVLSMAVAGPTHDTRSWAFDLDPGGRDPILGIERLQEAYFARIPGYDRGITVPAIVDIPTGQVVTNDVAQITLDLSTQWRAYHRPGAPDLYPEGRRAEIDGVNDVVFADVNNGVYRCGFASTQEAYEKAYRRLFDRLDWLSARLERQRYLVGDTITEADVRLFTTLVRFDAVYHGHFNCNRHKLAEMPVLWAYTRDLFTTPGFGDTIDFNHIKRHYYQVHRDINPTGIVPAGPDLSGWLRPHGRNSLGGRPFGDGTPPGPPLTVETVPPEHTPLDHAAGSPRKNSP
jgi:glutathionyl-hydroquinone reductase